MLTADLLLLVMLVTSVTRLDEISPLRQNVESLWQSFQNIGRNFYPTLANFDDIGQISIVVNG